ncbi:Thymus-specific serine protease, partial [Mortierella sp. GBA43]
RRPSFVKTLSLRHKPTMEWGIDARVKSRMHWDKYWHQLEATRQYCEGLEGRLESYQVGVTSDKQHGTVVPTKGTGEDESATGSMNKNDLNTCKHEAMGGLETDDTCNADNMSTTSVDDEDAMMGYFYFRQPLDHFSGLSPSSPSLASNSTFRQYYQVNSEFYRPGGPIILWIPGESPLHPLFLSRGLAYELANATSGLLVALEHRFYGRSIPRFQDSSAFHKLDYTCEEIEYEMPEDASSDERRARDGWTAARVDTFSSSGNSNTSNNTGKEANNATNDGADEGFPLDLLQYLTLDQSIDDIIYFIDHFATLQPSFANTFTDPTEESSLPRWILAGCSYGGNLAAWTRQRYPSKVFAAFASSAPLRSALDFYEYSTSQTQFLGKQCSHDLALVRDFLDGALQTTDEFMQQMAYLDQTSLGNDGEDHPISSSSDGRVADNDKEARRAAKLRVLSWFSPDFAQDYAQDGEEAHAAGWIWWTVASAVQYNSVTTGSGVEPIKTTLDVLCETMSQSQEMAIRMTSAGTSSPMANLSSVESIRYAKALATWFRDQQYFTPTRAEDLQPSDMDPNSMKNLASIAWLWQTCSELGYLQTSQPSNCCCPTRVPSAPFPSPSPSSSPSSLARAQLLDSLQCHANPLYPQELKFSVDTSLFSQDEWISTAAKTNGTTATTRPPRKPATGCLPCRCYAREGPPQTSVFSRLLTLEAAWQECQYYFGSTHGLHQNPSKKPPTANAPSEKGGGRGSNNSNPIVGSKPHQQIPGGDGGGRRPSGKNSSDHSNATTTTTTTTTAPLLHGYPDVDKNVNDKFHGWEIVGKLPFLDDHNEVMIDEALAPPPPVLATDDDDDIEGAVQLDQYQHQYQPQSPIHSKPQPQQPQPNSFQDHGRYYFTNGENDPWKDLTLASTQALEFLRHPILKGDRKSHITSSKANKTSFSSPSSIVPDSTEPSSAAPTDGSTSPWTEATDPLKVNPGRVRPPHGPRYRNRRPPRPRKSRNSGSRGGQRKASHRRRPLSGLEQGSDSSEPTLPFHPVSQARGTNDDGDDPERGIMGDNGDDNRSVIRIIPGASHCQDILYESSDLESVELREQRQHVLQTFVRWIEMDVQRQQRIQRQRQGRYQRHGGQVHKE